MDSMADCTALLARQDKDTTRISVNLGLQLCSIASQKGELAQPATICWPQAAYLRFGDRVAGNVLLDFSPSTSWLVDSGWLDADDWGWTTKNPGNCEAA